MELQKQLMTGYKEPLIVNILIVLFQIAIFSITFAAMELAANMTHRYIMHGVMWYFHKDHHQKEAGFFEKNDIFFIIFAVPAMLLIISGLLSHIYTLSSIGIGITAYGFAYFWVHEIYIHRRLKLLDKIDSPYLQALARAHKDHHSIIEKEDGLNFGMLWVPIKYHQNAS